VQDAAGNYVQYLGPNFSNTLANTLSYTGDNDGIEVTNSTPLLTGRRSWRPRAAEPLVSAQPRWTLTVVASVTFQFQTTQDAASSMSNVVVWIINGTPRDQRADGSSGLAASCDATAGTCTYDVTVTLPANARASLVPRQRVAVRDAGRILHPTLHQYDISRCTPWVGTQWRDRFLTLGFDPSNYTITDELSQ